MTKYVVSTLTADNLYTKWVNDNGTNNVAHQVLIKGGAGVADPKLVAVLGAGTNTREGVITEVSDEDAAFLATDPGFKFHQERGFVKIISRNANPETVAKSMEKDEGSRPRNEGDVKAYAKRKGDDTLQAVTNKK